MAGEPPYCCHLPTTFGRPQRTTPSIYPSQHVSFEASFCGKRITMSFSSPHALNPAWAINVKLKPWPATAEPLLKADPQPWKNTCRRQGVRSCCCCRCRGGSAEAHTRSRCAQRPCLCCWRRSYQMAADQTPRCALGGSRLSLRVVSEARHHPRRHRCVTVSKK